MVVWRRMVRHEWRTLGAEGTVPVVIVIVVGCLGAALWVGHAWRERALRTVQAVRAADAARLDSLQHGMIQAVAELRASGTPLDPVPFGYLHGTMVGHYQGTVHAAMPPSSLAAFAIGQSDLAPVAIRISVDTRQHAAGRHPMHPHALRVGHFDLAFVIVYLIPLLVLALSFTLVAGEKNAGTLPLLLAQRLTVRRLAVAKVMPRAVGLTLLVVLVSAVAFGVVGERTAEADAFGRLAVWTTAAVVYSLFWLAVAAAIDARGRGTTVNALAFVAVWLTLVVVMPSVASVATRTVRPVASRAVLDETFTRVQQGIWAMPPDSIIARLVRRRPTTRIALSPPESLERFMVYQMATLEMMDSVLAPVETAFARAAEAHRRLASAAGWLSPALLVHRVLTDAAGTGEARYAEFRRQVTAHQVAWRAYFTPRIYDRVPVTDLQHVPHFTYREEPLGALVARAAPPIALTAGLTLVLALGAAGAYRRYPVIG